MITTTHLRLLSAALLFASILPSRLSASPVSRPPNILLIYADDLGWSDVGFHGSRYYETPRIDHFAAESLRFTDAYASAPLCSPSRASLMFGQYPPRTGCYSVGRPHTTPGVAEGLALLTPAENNPRIPLDKICFAQPLADAGYATAFFGKWHLGDSGDFLPFNRGFTHGFILPDVHLQDDFGPFTTIPPRPSPIGIPQSDFLVQEALSFMEEHRDRPFFVEISFYVSVHASNKGTHTSPDPALTAKYFGKPPAGDDKDPAFAAKVGHMDRLVGHLLDRLDALGLAENTVVIFYSDNGGVGGYHQLGSPLTRSYTDNAPLRAGKATLYEGGIRVPLIIRWPGVTPVGGVCSIPVTGVDFYPTFLDLARAPAPRDYPLDGVSLLPIIHDTPRPQAHGHESLGRALWTPYPVKPALDQSPPQLPVSQDLLSGARPIFWHFPVYYGNRLKNPSWVNTPNSAIRLGRFKLIEFFEEPRTELYDLVADLGEQSDISKTHPEITAQLHALLQHWQRSSGAFIPKPAPQPSGPPDSSKSPAAADSSE